MERMYIDAIISAILWFLLVALFQGCQKSAVATDVLEDIDGNTYRTVVIGEQCWMAENLRTTRYSNGDAIAKGHDSLHLWGVDSASYYFEYPDDNPLQESDALYTKLKSGSLMYTWAAATNFESNGSHDGIVQGVCPDGWHVPGKKDWEELITFVGRDSAATRLKSANSMFWQLDDEVYRGTDEYGFSALGSGGRDSAGAMYIFNAFAYFWTSTTNPYEDWRVETPFLTSYSHEIQWLGYSKTNAFCVRCVKNKE